MAEAHGGYYLPHPSHWPISGSIALFTLAIGTACYFQGFSWGPWVMLLGFAILIFMVFGWLGTVIGESISGAYNDQVDRSFRWGMSWFIFSEVMFFGAFFGALFYAHVLSVPWLAGGDAATNQLLWHGQSFGWTTAGPGFPNVKFEAMEAWPLATFNTIFLLASSVTVTIAHHALKDGDRDKVKKFMFITVGLGLLFLICQGYEFWHAWNVQNMTLHTGVYGSTFFMLTGFHGFHVTLGTTMLIVITARILKGHFDQTHHFAFEGVSWYWHFVDVVWLGLFVFVYILA
ncbi:MAG TPA: cytochrome c oxidase subunit 3 [Nitrococcus sp.]|nr:cytochrome c oxidase subunit 3 [Nitrococcus sp.]